MLKISSLEKLVHELSRLPGIGPKTAQRLAYYILKSKDNYVERMQEALMRVKAEVHECPACYNFTDADLCKFCQDSHRSDDLVCVVEEPSDIMRIEASGAFRGRYHVLHGSIAPLEGIRPEDLKIQQLLERVKQSQLTAQPIQELILALDSDLEGDTTVLYITRKFQNLGIKISRIAQGIPMGSDIDFIDDRTMGRALENRLEIEQT